MSTNANAIREASFYSDEKAGRLILQNLRDAFILVNAELAVVYCNRAAWEKALYYNGVEIQPGISILDLGQDYREGLLPDTYLRVLQGEQHRTETELVSSSGEVSFYELCFYPAYDKEGSIAGIIISSKEITSAKKIQRGLRQSEERLQFALEAAAQGAWDWNLQTNEVIYSSSYKKLYGFEDGDLKNHASEWMTRIHPDDQQKMQSSVEEHLEAENYEYDSQYRIRAKDGSYRWVMAKGRLVAFDAQGKPLRMIGTHTDITDAVERELALQRMNERFDCMMKATHELLWEWDIPNQKVFRARDAVKKVYGVENESEIDTLEQWMLHIHPDEQLAVRNKWDEIRQGAHQQTFELEYRFRRDDGSYAHIYDRCILLLDEKRNPLRLIGAAQDISERKRLEKELINTELEYQRLLHQATVESQEKERAEIGKELHDNVNQVLTTTKLYLDLAIADPALKDELLNKSLVNINTVIQEIRHLSRSLMEPSIGDLGLIDSIKDLVENIHLTQRLQIDFRADGGVEGLLCAHQKLTVFRIIQESLNNVLRHANASKAVIKIEVLTNQIKLVIRDNGVGIKNLKKGAGLKNIQNRIYLIHGTLQLKSKPGEGCTLELQFPIETND